MDEYGFEAVFHVMAIPAFMVVAALFLQWVSNW